MLCLSCLYLPCQKIDAPPAPYFLSQIFLDFLIRRRRVRVQMCARVYLHICTRTHMYDIHTLPLATLTEIQCTFKPEGGLPEESQEEQDRAGSGLSWSGVRFCLPGGPGAGIAPQSWFCLQARRLAFVPLLLSHGPPWELLG